MNLPVEHVGMKEFQELNSADLKQEKIRYVCAYKRQREGRPVKDDRPVAVVIPYETFLEWQRVFEAAHKAADEFAEKIGAAALMLGKIPGHLQ